jgi:hypothetical protein
MLSALLALPTFITLANAATTSTGQVFTDLNGKIAFPEWDPFLLAGATPIGANDFTLTYDYAFDSELIKPAPNNGLQFTLLPNPNSPKNPFGSRLSSVEKYTVGKVCFKPTLPLTTENGTILAIYTRSFDKEPNDCFAGDRWDELDFEFLGAHPGTVWVNVFGSKFQNENGCTDQGYFLPIDIKPSYEFCMQWDARSTGTPTPNSALWFVYDEATGFYQTLRMELGRITNAMKVKMAFWGKSDLWAGDINLSGPVNAGVNSIRMWLAN